MGKLKTKYDKLEDIDEKYRDLFEEKDGKFLLTGIEGANDADAVARMGKQRDDARKEANDAKAKLKAFEALGDRDPTEVVKILDEVEDLKSQLEEAKQAGGKTDEAIQKRIDAAVTRAEARHKRELENAAKEHEKTKAKLAEEQGRVTTLDGRIKSGTVRDALVKAASEQKVKASAVQDLLMYAGSFEITEDGKVVTKDGVGAPPGISVSDWLADRKSDRSHWWDESVGGGAKGGNGGAGTGGPNPFLKDSKSFTKAQALVKANPAQALQFAKQAGHESIAAAMSALGKM